MSVIVGGASSSRTAPLVDFREDFNDYDPPPSGTQTNYVSRSPVPWRAAPGNGFNLVWNIVRDDPSQIYRVFELVSNGAGRGTQVLTGFNFPLGRIFGAAGAGPLNYRPLQRYTWTRAMRATVRGTARIEMGVTATNGGLSLLGNDPGVVWTSDPAVNGGLWTPQFRTVAAGAITNGTTAGVAPGANFQTLGIRMTERQGGVGNLVEWLFNDATIFASVVNVNSATVSTFFPISGTGATAGTTLRFDAQRFVVEEIG